MADIALRHICKSYPNGFCAVNDFNLNIRDGEFIIFVGPSGCGKSTTLRMIAGLEDISSGELWIGDQLVNFMEPQKRELSMVFQNYALYPHMSVYDNMAFGLKVRNMDRKEIDRRVKEAAKILEIEHLLNRKPAALSGGQKQRVAIGSVIVRQPSAYLMDEPLSNLDAKLRTQMRVELSRLHERLKSTFIYVTHDQVEAMTLGTRIVVMKEGIIQQVDTPARLYQNPMNLFVAGFIGSPSMNFVEAKAEFEDGQAYLSFEGNRVRVNENCRQKLLEGGYIGRTVILGVRPEDVHDRAEKKQSCSVAVQVQVRETLGAEVQLHGSMGRTGISARLKPDCTVQAGELVHLYLDMDQVRLFDPETEANLLYVRSVDDENQFAS